MSALAPRKTSRQGGLTLVELLVGMTLGLVLLVGVASIFLYTSRSNRQNELIAGMQDQARFALSTLSRDLTMAGYWGGMSSAAAIVNDATTTSSAFSIAYDCGVNATSGWAMQLTDSSTTVVAGVPQIAVWPRRVEFRNQNDATAVTAQWRCIGGWRSGTDVVALRRVAGQVTGKMMPSDTSAHLRAYQYYLQTNGVVGSLIRWGTNDTGVPASTDVPLSAPMSFYKYLPRIYFVRDFARTAGDGVPALCRKELCPTRFKPGGDGESGTCGESTAPVNASGMVTECLAEGVEDLQIVWGLSHDDNGAVERYTSTPSAEDVARRAQTAQIFLRIRSAQTDGSYTDRKTYTAGDAAAYTPQSVIEPSGTPENRRAKHYYRRVFSTTVYLRNPVR